MKLFACRSKPRAPLHLGEREEWREGSSPFIHSDTLFSAFCHSYLLLYGKEELSSLLQWFKNGNPPFLFSSIFPFWKETYYLPVPKNQIPKTKEAKKILFVEKKGFESLLKGESLEEVRKTIKTISKKEKPWVLENVPRISLSRLSNHPMEDGGLFHFGEVSYREDAGLFFLLHYNDAEWQKKVEATLRLLADEGIGGGRSVGKGAMRPPEFREIDLEIPEKADATLTLSLYFPSSQEREGLSEGFYELIERKGYIYSPYGQSLRRRAVRMFSEGSVFPSYPKRRGGLVDVTPKIFKHHPVYRYGFCFGIPCKMEEK